MAKPPFRAENIGSLLRPQELKDAFRDFHRGKLSPQQFQEIQDRCIREAIKLQEDVGLHAITDGEFRRGSWFFGFMQAVDGFAAKEASFTFHDEHEGGTTFQVAYIEDKLKRERGITTPEFSFLKAHTKETPKITMPAPSFAHFFRLTDPVSPVAYPHPDDFWPDLVTVYVEEIAELGRLGCTYVQLDEVAIAMLCDPHVRDWVKGAGQNPEMLIDRYIWAINEAVAQRPAGVTVGVHLCRGNYKGQWMAEGGYDVVAAKLFNNTKVDAFFLEYDSPRAGGFEPLRLMPADKRAILGLVSSKVPELEPLDSLKRRLDEASRFISLDQLGVSAQCGFASSVGGNPLTIEDERRKLARVVELANAVWP